MSNFTVKSNIHDYSVNFVEDFVESLKEVLGSRDFLIIDNAIVRLYGEKLKPILEQHHYIGIDASEKQKSYQGVESIVRELIERGFRKSDKLVAVGGGITQDTTAFMASVMYRGVKWLFYPTSLLAQGDSCIGSKTSINFDEYKNQIGGFYPPNAIYIDTAFLDSLEEKELKSGLGEMCHYFIVSSREDFDRFKSDYPQALVDKTVLQGIIKRSLEIKKSYIEIDEYDKKERQVFNYGHTFGHAIESMTNYRIPHGIAVSIGMDISNFVSVKLGLFSETEREHIRELLIQISEGYSIKEIDVEDYIKVLGKDKKNVGTQLGLILGTRCGDIFKKLVDPDDKFRSWMKEYFTTQIER